MNLSEPHFQDLLNSFQGVTPPRDRIRAFTLVRDIKYGDIGSRDPIEVLIQQKGTCSGKHALLKILLESLGYQVQSYFALHDFKNFPISTWPVELIEFKSKTLTDYHDFLKVNLGNKWIILDAMFDIGLKQFGFPVQDWDGSSDLEILVNVEEIFLAEPDMEAHKKRLISQLPEQVQKDRKEFLSQLTIWIDSHRD